ncbi:hypothetical protein [Pararhodobacter sp.]|uniref:hypothetical protein n=1 Tax=Pararhodobacter sp. TaxID=2127056 RepID=UPI002AFFBD2E|nr:hypothetical protein [Pararhodobacter sp.]
MSKSRSTRTTPNRRVALPLWRLGDGQPPAGPFIALVPGAEAPLITLALPASLKGVAREDVARRQAQDRLGGKGSALDIRPARLAAGDGWTRVVVADRAQVARWRTSLGAASSRCRGLVPDYMALPSAPGLWSFDQSGDRICARLGPEDGFTAEPALAAPLIRQALHQARAANTLPRAILWTGARNPTLEALFEGLSVVPRAEDLPDMLRPKAMAHGELALDFARDPRADAEAIETSIRRLVWPAILLLMAAIGWAGATMISIRNDLATARAVEAQTVAAARRDLLGAGPILDLRVQVARALEARRGGAAADAAPLAGLDLLRAVAEVMTRTDARVLGVAMGRTVEGVVLDTVVDDFRALDGVIATLEQAGLIASLTRSGINPEGGVAATLSVQGGAS